MSKICTLWNAIQLKSKLVKKKNRRRSSPLMSVKAFGRGGRLLEIGNAGVQ